MKVMFWEKSKNALFLTLTSQKAVLKPEEIKSITIPRMYEKFLGNQFCL